MRGLLDGLTILRDMRCAEMLAHAEAPMERGTVATRECRGRDNNFVNGQAGRGDVRDFRNGFLHPTYDYYLLSKYDIQRYVSTLIYRRADPSRLRIMLPLQSIPTTIVSLPSFFSQKRAAAGTCPRSSSH